MTVFFLVLTLQMFYGGRHSFSNGAHTLEK